MTTIIFTDGSARGNPGPGGWAAIIADKEKVVEIGGSDPHSTNNRMEMTAVIRALQSTDSKDIRLYTDSEYILKGITIWIIGWQNNNWKTAARKPVINQDLWQEMAKAKEGRIIEWILVRGHSGVPANERCDVIATEYADGKKPDLYNGPREGYKISFNHVGRA